MALPHKISTLLYCFNARDEVLLLERAQEPNLAMEPQRRQTPDGRRGVPPCVRVPGRPRGTRLRLSPADLHLTGLVSEHGYAGQAHWLMFLFEVKGESSPCRHHPEGRFAFFRGRRWTDCGAANGPGDDLAAVLATSRRLLRGPLPCVRGWASRLDGRGIPAGVRGRAVHHAGA